MGSKSLLVVVVLAALGGLLWISIGSDGGRGAPTAGAPAAEDVPPGRSAPAELAPVPALAPEAIAPAAAPATGAARVESLPTAGERWLVRVQCRGVPVLGVEVGWTTPHESRTYWTGREDEMPSDKVLFWRLAGHRTRTDAAGEAHVPVLPHGACLSAWDETRLAQRRIEEGDAPPIVLELELERTLRVHVVDEAGAPRSGLPVLLDLMRGRTNYQLVQETGADGLVTFLHVGLGWSLGWDHLTGKAVLVGLFEGPIEVAFDSDSWPAEPLELIAPSTGSVVVTVRAEETNAFEVDHDVELENAVERLPGVSLWNEGASASVEEGRARFAAVALGLRLRATLHALPRWENAEVAFDGPTRPGEEVTAALVLTRPAVELTFRVLDASGSPVRVKELEASLTRRMGGGSIASNDIVTTSFEGYARMPLTEGWSPGTTRTLTLKLVSESGAQQSLEVDLSREIPKGVTDLGDLRLAGASILVSGRVVDRQGEPVEHASLQVQRAYSRGEGQEPLWNTALSALCTENGTFALHDEPPASELRLVVEAKGHVRPAPIPFVPGTRDLEIVLERGGAIEGSLVPLDGVGMQTFGVEVDPDGNGARRTQVEDDGRFRIDGLPPGTVDVRITMLEGLQELCTVPAVIVSEGERDPRLQGVDLADLVRRIVVRVRLADGSLAASGWVRVLDSGEGWRDAAFLIEAGESRVLARKRPVDLEVNVAGQRVVRLRGVESDQDVVLEPAFLVRLELAPDVDLPPEGSSLQVQLTPLGAGGAGLATNLTLFRDGRNAGWWSPAFGDATNTFGAAREVELAAQELGPHEVGFTLVWGDPGGARMSFGIPASAATRQLELGASSAGRGFVVEPERAAYTEYLARGR